MPQERQPTKVELAAEGIIVRFGKYNGRNLLEIAEADADYLHWLASLDDKPQISAAAKALGKMARFKVDPGETKMPFGKYDGMTLKEIMKENAGYLDWVLENVEHLPGNLRQDIEKVVAM